MIPIRVFEGRKVALFGLGLSGIAAGRALAAGGTGIAAWDDGEEGRARGGEAGLPLVDLKTAGWGEFAALVLAPGVPLTHPEPHWAVKKAQRAGVEVIGDTELFFRQREAEGSHARVVAITGTNGKSTTAVLTAHLLRTAGLPTSLGGNIGTAILDLEPLSDGRVYVIEFSSYQIDLTPGLRADAAALLNITPDHLDRHGDLTNYAAVKARIFSGLAAGGTAVIGIDDAPCRTIAGGLRGPFSISRISVERPVKQGVYARAGKLIEVRSGVEFPPVSIEGVGSLRGQHNAQNAACALALCIGLGIKPDVIAKGLRGFPGLAHRMEEIGRLGKVLFVNDSKATNADAAAHALASFPHIHWIAGGRAKSGGLDGLDRFYPRIARAYLIGEAAEPFAKKLDGQVDHIVCGTLRKAVEQAAADAAASDAAEPVVLLSPACASFDQYRSFAVRGDAFRAAVSELAGVTMKERAAA